VTISALPDLERVETGGVIAEELSS